MANILHSSLASSEAHEVKGAQGATLGYVLTSDGSDSATFQDPQSLIDSVEEAPNDGNLYSRSSLGWVLTPTVPTVLYYRFDDTTNTPPSNKTLKFNNVDQVLATEIHFDDKDLTNREVDAILNYQAIGNILHLSMAQDASQGQAWVINSITNHGGHTTYGITPATPITFLFTDNATVIWKTFSAANVSI